MGKKEELTHIDDGGAGRMVDVGEKAVTRREAVAEAWVKVGAEVAALITEGGGVAKGEVLETSRLAGMMAAKRTAEFIPMCHPLSLDVVEVTAEVEGDSVHIIARAKSEGKTGVEMEAMTAAGVAALTVYDMCKSAGKGIEIEKVRLLEKSGGKRIGYAWLEKYNSGP